MGTGLSLGDDLSTDYHSEDEGPSESEASAQSADESDAESPPPGHAQVAEYEPTTDTGLSTEGGGRGGQDQEDTIEPG